MSPRSIAAVAAIVVAVITVALSTDCGAGGVLILGSGLAGALAAIWNDNPERGIADRTAKFLVIVFMAGVVVLFCAFVLKANRCG